jgi:uncharacterized protein YkwD
MMKSAAHLRHRSRLLAAGLVACLCLLSVPVQTVAAPRVPVVNAARPANVTINSAQLYVNTYRLRALVVPPVVQNSRLNNAAYAHAADMARRRHMSHTGSDGSNAGTRISRTGYRWWTWGENVAAGQTTVAQVMGAWYQSLPHRRIMLNPNFRQMGLGRAYAADGTQYWCLVFATPA